MIGHRGPRISPGTSTSSGGEQLEAAIGALRTHAPPIAFGGMVSQYNDEPAVGVRNLLNLWVTRS